MNGAPLPIAWLSVTLGAASWAFASVVPIGLDVAAVVLGLLALRGARGKPARERVVPWIGIALGLSKLLAMAGLIVWLVIAFSRNPVAH